MHVQLRVGGEVWGERRGGQACTGTVAGRVGELRGGRMWPSRVVVVHAGGQREAPHGQAPLLLLLPLAQVVT